MLLPGADSPTDTQVAETHQLPHCLNNLHIPPALAGALPRLAVHSRSVRNQLAPMAAPAPTRVAFSADSRWLAGLLPDSKGVATLGAISLPAAATEEDGPLRMSTVISAADIESHHAQAELSLEEQLKRERTRNLISGLSSFEWSPADATASLLLIPHGGDLFIAEAPSPGSAAPEHWKVTKAYDHLRGGLTGPAMESQWAPSGEWVLFVQDGEVLAVSARAVCAEASAQDEAGGSGGTWQVCNGHVCVRLTQGAWESAGTSAPFKQGEVDYLAQESFERFKGFWISEDCRWLAYQRTSDAHIPDFTIRHQHTDDPYAKEVHKYPFPGKANPHISLHMMPLSALADLQCAGVSPADVQQAAGAVKGSVSCSPPIDVYGHMDWYLARAAWDAASGLLAIFVNRSQNQRHLLRIPCPTSHEGACGQPQLLIHEAATHWVDSCFDSWGPVLGATTGDDGGAAAPSAPLQLIWTSERSGHSHLYLYEYTPQAEPPAIPPFEVGRQAALPQPAGCPVPVWEVEGGTAREVHPLTQGTFSVTSLDRVDAGAGLVFITANAKSPVERTPFVVGLDGSSVKDEGGPSGRPPNFASWFNESVTAWGRDMELWGLGMAAEAEVSVAGCHISRVAPHACTIDGAHGRWVAYESSSMCSRPAVSLAFRPADLAGKPVPFGKVKQSGAMPLVSAGLPPPQLFALPIESGQHTLIGAYWLPKGSPVGPSPPTAVVSVYGGPHIQYVQMSWPFMGGDANVTQLLLAGYAVVRVDNRGSQGRGVLFEAAVHKNMGGPEVQDQRAAVEWLMDRGIIAKSGVGVTGWSYGGYMSLMCAMQHPSLFRAAVAGAPVTHWQLYDSGYTERFMGIPAPEAAASSPDDEVQEAYRKSSVEAHIQTVSETDNKPHLLIIHGMLDENVHFRHTARLSAKLLSAGIPFDSIVLPSERHGARGARPLIAKRSAEFFAAHLGMPGPGAAGRQ